MKEQCFILEHLEAKVFSLVDENLYQTRRKGAIEKLVLHRNSVSSTASGLITWFFNHGLDEIGSKKMPYHWVIEQDGSIKKTVPMRFVTPGAYGKNANGVHICFIGDFRKDSPTKAQIESGKTLLCKLKEFFPEASIEGHSAEKQCPGPRFPQNFENQVTASRTKDFLEKARTLGEDSWLI